MSTLVIVSHSPLATSRAHRRLQDAVAGLGGADQFEVVELLKPLLATAHFVGMSVLPPPVLHHVPNVPGIAVPADVDRRVDAFARHYRDLLAGAPVSATAAQP